MPPSAAPDLTANAWIVIDKGDLAAGLPRGRGSGHACGSCSNNQDLRFNCKKGRTTFTHHSSLSRNSAESGMTELAPHASYEKPCTGGPESERSYRWPPRFPTPYSAFSAEFLALVTASRSGAVRRSSLITLHIHSLPAHKLAALRMGVPVDCHPAFIADSHSA